MLTAERSRQDALVRAYPDMATLVVADEERADSISQDVGSLALDSLAEEDVEALRDLSARYEERFGLPFVAYLGAPTPSARSSRTGVRRLAHSPSTSGVALTEVAEIAGDRFGIMVADANPSAPPGRGSSSRCSETAPGTGSARSPSDAYPQRMVAETDPGPACESCAVPVELHRAGDLERASNCRPWA